MENVCLVFCLSDSYGKTDNGNKEKYVCDELLNIFPLVLLSTMSEPLRGTFCFSFAICLLSHLTPTRLFLPPVPMMRIKQCGQMNFFSLLCWKRQSMQETIFYQSGMFSYTAVKPSSYSCIDPWAVIFPLVFTTHFCTFKTEQCEQLHSNFAASGRFCFSTSLHMHSTTSWPKPA